MTDQSTSYDVPEELREYAIHQRVVTTEPYAPPSPPGVDIQTEPGSSRVLDIVIQAAYMLPVVGNVMSIGDVARDIVVLCEDDSNNQPNHQNVWLWGVLVIDSIGIIPAAGNASRPIRLATREGILAFVRGEGIHIVAELLWNQAGGDALEFIEGLQSWMEGQKDRFRRFASDTITGIQSLVIDPVSGAEQMGLIERNPAWYDVPEHGKRITLIAFDQLVGVFGEEARQRLIQALEQLRQMADSMIVSAIDNLLPVLGALVVAMQARRRGRRNVEHNGLAITGQPNTHRRGAAARQSTNEGRNPSQTPAGCACRTARPTASPVRRRCRRRSISGRLPRSSTKS